MAATDDRESSEAALRESEARYRACFDDASVGEAIVALDGRFLEVNEAFASMVGYTVAELCEKKFFDLTHPDDVASSVSARKALLEGERAIRLEKRYLRKDGSVLWVDVNVAAQRDSSGNAIRCITHIIDLSTRKRIQAALTESEERFRGLFEASRDALTTVAPPTWSVRSANAAALAMFKASSLEDLVSLRPWDLSPERQPDGRVSAEAAMELIEKAMREGSAAFEWTHTRLSGEDFPADILLTRMEHGGQQFLQATVRDITERKAVQAALRRSEERFRELFTHMGSGVAVYEAVDGGRDFVLRDLNAAAERTDRVTRAAALGRRLTELFPGVAAMGLLDVFREVYRSGRPAQQSATLYQDERFSSWFETSAYRLSSGEIVAIHDEVTERRSIEDQLRLAQKMEAVGRLAGGVAHDFNNLLSVIMSYATFALDSVREGDPLRDDILEITKAGTRASAVVQQLLAFSRKQLIQPEILDLNRVVANLEGMLQRLLGDDVEVVTMLAPDLSTVKVDRGQIEQVLMNLAVNARDAMPKGGTFTVETANVELDQTYASLHPGINPGAHVMLSVTDTGSGMDEPTLARIFEPFFTTKEAGGGTGLGLATVYGIVKQSGGDVCASSELGRGTTFRIHLPRAIGSVAAVPHVSLSEEQAKGDETILLVEDEEMVRALTRRILVAAGYTVLAAPNAGSALLHAERHAGRVHLMLTDVVMPQMSGKELAVRIEKVCPGIRVLYMSGYADDTIVRHGLLEAGTHFIAKPFKAADLTAKVREVLDEGR